MARRAVSVNGLDMNEVFEAPEEAGKNTEVSIRTGNIKSKGKLAGYFQGLKKKLSKDKEKNSSISRSNSMKSAMSNSQFYSSLTKSRGSSVEGDVASGSSSPSTPTPIIEELDIGEGPVHKTRMNEFGNLNETLIVSPGTGSESEIGGIEVGTFEDSQNRQQFPFYTLTVELINGKNLVVKDKSGSSDPYVKVRLGEKTLYKSKVITANLNPTWDEKFVLPIDDLKELLTFKVVDYDWGSKDDFMGLSIVDLNKLPLEKCQPVTLPLTKKGVLGTKPMGELSVLFTLTPRTLEEKQIWFTDTNTIQTQIKMQRHAWNGVLTVLLIDAHSLPPRSGDPPGGYANVFAKLRFGNEKRNSKHINEVTLKPQWLEQFDFYLFEGSGQAKVLEIQLFEESSVGRVPIGCCSLDISDLEKDVTHEKILKLFNGMGQVSTLVTISGIRPFSLDSTTTIINKDDLKTQYSIPKTLHLSSITDVGHLTVTVHEAEGLYAADIGGKSDPYCVLQLINTRVQTHTDYKTLTPKWNKTFQFPVRDITAQLEVTVFDEDRDYKFDFLGKIIIPLWRIQTGEKKWYKLKNRKLGKGARGKNPQILLEMDLIWNPIRAAVRVTDPQEVPYITVKPQLRIETFLINMERLRQIAMDVFDIWLYIKSCLDWEYPDRSMKALIIYQLFFFFFQPFFIPLLILIYWLRPWWQTTSFDRNSIVGSSARPEAGDGATAAASSEVDSLVFDEDVDYEDEEIKKLSLLEKFTLLQDASGVLQELLGELASICESTINSRRMVVPFIYWLFVLLFTAVTLILLVIPFRYVAMIFGLHEFLRVFLRPWKKSTFELYHMIRRVPDQQKMAARLGVHSVLKSIQQLKKPKRGILLNTQKKSTSTTGTGPPPTLWYTEQD